MNTAVLEVGKPYLWKSPIYGDIAVHFVGLSRNGKVAKLTIDGGVDSTPAQTHLALKDGIGYAVVASGEIHKRTTRQRTPKRKSPSAGDVPQAIRNGFSGGEVTF